MRFWEWIPEKRRDFWIFIYQSKVDTMKKYKDNEGRRVVEVDSLAFLYERYGYSWLKRHIMNRRHKRALKRADVITAPDAEVAYEIEKYYFIPKESVTVK